MNLIGPWNAAAGLFPTTGGSGTGGTILDGDTWHVTVAGILDGEYCNVGALIIKITGGWLIKAA